MPCESLAGQFRALQSAVVGRNLNYDLACAQDSKPTQDFSWHALIGWRLSEGGRYPLIKESGHSPGQTKSEPERGLLGCC